MQAPEAAAAALHVERDELGEEVRNLFVHFIENFREHPDSPTLPYVQQLAVMKANDRTTLYVDFLHLLRHNAELGEALEDDYFRVEPFLCAGLKLCVAQRYPDYLVADQAERRENVFWVALYNVPATHKLRDLTSSKIGKLLAIGGTVTRTSEVRPELLKARFVCQQCRSLTGFVLQQFCYTEPNKCTNDQCTNTKRWELDAATSVFTDWQKVRIQEASADIPSGSMPRSLDVILRNEAVDKAKAGDSSIFTGTLIVVPDVTQFNLPGVKAKGKSSSGGDGTRGLKQTGVRDLTYRLCFLASTVRLAELRSGSVNLREEEEDNVVDELTEEQKKTIFEMSQRPSIYADLTASVAPTVFGHDEIKRGLLLMLLGGVHKETVEGINLRGDINICIVGDPSTSKSQFLKYVVKFMPRAVYTSGKASSAAGLTATVAKDPDTGEFNIEAGALMLADNGICCIAAGTRVALADGTSSTIERVAHLCPPLLSPRLQGRRVVLDPSARCSRGMWMGVKACVELTFEDGRVLVCTPDHRVLTACGQWVEAGTVRGEQALAVAPVDPPLCDGDDDTVDDSALAAARRQGWGCALRPVALVDAQCWDHDEVHAAHQRAVPALTSVALAREYVAAMFGARGLAPTLDSPHLVRLPLADASHAIALLARCGVGTCVAGGELAVDALEFAARVGFRYAAHKQLRLAVACMWLRARTAESCTVFLGRIGAAGWLDPDACVVRPGARTLPTVALRVVGRRSVGPQPVYDLSVPGNHAFVANGVTVHNCIDEFDKMDIRDQVAIHEAMEQQTISIAKAGIHATLNARTSVLAAANPIGGRYDKTKTLTGNLNISAPIMSRFDLFFIVIDDMDEAADLNVARHIVTIHRLGDQGVAPPFTTQQLYDYIRFAKTIKPTLTPEAQTVLVEEYKRLRQNDVGAAGKTAYRITVRQLESMIRLSEALARVHLETEVRPEYVREASRLLRKSIIHVESEDLVLSERPRPAQQQDAGDDAQQQPPQQQQQQPAAEAVPAGKRTLSFAEYKRITDLVVMHLRGCEERGEGAGKTAAQLVQWYLDQCDAATEDDLARHSHLIALILKRLISKDHVLIEHYEEHEDGAESPALLTVHPNYVAL